jgi:hypothetical protein
MRFSPHIRQLGMATCLVIASACWRPSPTEPVSGIGSFSGMWAGAADRGPCGEDPRAVDWSAVVITMQQSGRSITGEIVSAPGLRYPLSGTVEVDHVELNVGGLSGTSCYFFMLYVNTFEHDARGRLVGFSGFLQGRCCGTVAGAFHFARQNP